MIERLLAKMDTNLAKTEAKLNAYLEKPEAWLQNMKVR
jgi:hypothetical protein